MRFFFSFFSSLDIELTLDFLRLLYRLLEFPELTLLNELERFIYFFANFEKLSSESYDFGDKTADEDVKIGHFYSSSPLWSFSGSDYTLLRIKADYFSSIS